MLKHNLGISKNKPNFVRFNYIEKAEYWMLAWGSIIMVIAGAILSFANVIMRHFPKWMSDVADTVHFYEAILATIAIIIWHFYFSIFIPTHYPIDWSWLTGKISKEE